MICTFINVHKLNINNVYSNIDNLREKNFRIMERKRSSGFRRIFTVAFLLSLAPAWGPNPTGPIY